MLATLKIFSAFIKLSFFLILLGGFLLIMGWYKTYELSDGIDGETPDKFWFKARQFGETLLLIGAIATVGFFILYLI